jgi:Sec-independent protein secretion pathway component TatC
MDSNTKRFIMETLMWISIYFGIAFVVSIFLPFPYSLIAIVIAILGLGLYRRRRQLRKAGHTTSGGSSYLGNIFGSERAINYYCINCGTKHNEVSCPNCGSKLKKAGF